MKEKHNSTKISEISEGISELTKNNLKNTE